MHSMKFLLAAVNAKYIHSNPAIYSLRSYAGKSLREHIELAEYTVNMRMEQILSDIYKRKPDAIGFSCYIWNWSLVRRLVRELHKILPGAPIWLGGPEVSFEYGKILEEFPEVTGIMIGEGEETFRQLVQAYKEQEQILGAAETEKCFSEDFCISGTVTRNGIYPDMGLLSMDSLPFYYGELDSEEAKQFEKRIIYYESSRGCPFHCSYCLSSIEKQVRFRSTELVKKELQFFLDKRVKQVKFIDRTFNCNPGRALEIWEFLLKNDNGVTNFHFEIAAELLDEEELRVLSKMRAGLIQLEIGVQTTNVGTLKAIHRVCNPERLKETVAAINAHGNIHQHLDLIAGLPQEGLESFRKSFNEVYAMKPNQLQLGFLKVLKGSEMYHKAEEYGIVYQSEPPYEVLYTRWLSYGDIQELKRVEEMVELFYNSSQFTHTLPVLEKLFKSAYDMFSSLAEFYEENGFFIKSPARSYQYEMLLEFIKKRESPERPLEKLFAELLTFDVYLRENAKSRPVFARKLDDYRSKMSAFYRHQEKVPDVCKAYVEKGYDSRQMAHMMHMEVFNYPVWDTKRLARMEIGRIEPGEETFVLFDYGKRNPLTHEAGYRVVEMDLINENTGKRGLS